MNHATASLNGAGGRQIFWQSWDPDPAHADPARGDGARSEPTTRGVVVIVHGAGEHSGRYGHVAQRLVQAGFAVFAADHQGHGRSAGDRAVIDRINGAVADLDQLVTIAGAAHPGLPIFMLGHSMGATVSLEYAIAHQQRLAGLILSSALAALDAAPAPMRLLGRTLSAVAPRLPLIGVDASLVSRDPAVVAAYRSDPLVHHGKLPARTVAELVAAAVTFPQRVTAITIPFLILYGTADRLCPPAGSVMLAERIGAADKTVYPYQGLYHEILNEPEQDTVLADVCGWLDVHAVDTVPTAAG
ncbi:MAG: lysophospholipase [Solirubrobacteraceae bacterium]